MKTKLGKTEFQQWHISISTIVNNANAQEVRFQSNLFETKYSLRLMQWRTSQGWNI